MFSSCVHTAGFLDAKDLVGELRNEKHHRTSKLYHVSSQNLYT
jgi:hypothetical protein